VKRDYLAQDFLRVIGGHRAVRIEGDPQLLDAGDAVLHLSFDQVRDLVVEEELLLFSGPT
jgi:hypothetical protein